MAGNNPIVGSAPSLYPIINPSQAQLGFLFLLTFVEPFLEGIAGNAPFDSGIEFAAGFIHAIEGDEDVSLGDDKALVERFAADSLVPVVECDVVK